MYNVHVCVLHDISRPVSGLDSNSQCVLCVELAAFVGYIYIYIVLFY